MKKQMKLRNTILFTTILITTTILLVLGFVFTRQFRSLLTERMADDYQETVNTMQKNVETLINYAQDFSKYMSLNDGVRDAIIQYDNMTEENRILDYMELKENWDGLSNELIYSTSMIYSLEIYSGDTMVYSYYDDPMNSDQKNIPDEVLEKAINQNSPVWTDLLNLKQYRSYAKRPQYGFAVVKSVRNSSEKRIGTIAIYIRESSFSDILEPLSGQSNGQYYLVNKDDKVVSSVDKSDLYRTARRTLGISQEEYEQCVEEGQLLVERKNEAPVLYVSRAIGENGLTLVGQTAMEELVSQQKSTGLFIAGMIILSVILAFVGAWITSRRVTKPLYQLMDVMGQIKAGGRNSHQRFPEGNTGEVGVLGKRFNELMDELDTSMQQIYEEQRQRRHNEVRLLQAQIVPHFLYNTMGIISSFIKLGMTEKALATIQNLVSFYRLSLSSGKDIITIREEIELTRNYMELQQLRYIEYMDYMIDCEEAAEEIWIPKLTIQPLMENVLNHGLKPGGEKCLIQASVTVDEQKKMLRICVYDNGAGIERARLEQLRESLETGKSITKSFGIFNINQRLKLLYGKNYHMKIDSVEGEYTRIMLYLPMENNYGDERHV